MIFLGSLMDSGLHGVNKHAAMANHAGWGWRGGGVLPPPEEDQMEKLVPQPQEATALGFRIWKDWPIRSSTKSTTEPPI